MTGFGFVELRIFTEPQQGASYDDLLRVARTAEDAGYGAFFRSDHYLKMGSVSGLPGQDEVVERISQWRERTGIQRVYLDHVTDIASDVMPKL